MVDVAYLFPGQGAQYVGMGKDLYERFPQAKEVFEKANEIINFDLAKLCFEGPLDELTRTEISQPAIFITSLAALKVFETSEEAAADFSAGGGSANLCGGSLRQHYTPKFAAGLSLGEYTALVAAGSLAFEDGVDLVRKRGLYMEEASRLNPGTMASILGLPREAVEEICEQSGAEIANLNSPGQVVVSGRKECVAHAVELAKEKGARKAIPLQVSGAFHSSCMEPATEKLKVELERVNFNAPAYPVISNVTGRPETSPEEIKGNLARQLTSSTLWEESMRFIIAEAVRTFLEIGPGKVLRGLLKRIDDTATVHNFP